MRLSLAVLLVCCAAGVTLADDLEPGLVWTRLVTSAHVTAPTGIAVSPEGVAFVSCDVNGATNKRRRAGKVVRCEDTNGDGVADRFSTFVDGIDAPRGSCYVDDTLYLMQSPLLVAYRDPNGDGVAEEKATLVTGLGPGLDAGPVVHGPNGVRMGIDGWLYLAIGDQGCLEATGTDGSKATLRGGGILRVRPDGSRLEVLVTGTRNVYDVAVDPWLGLFARDNTNDGGGWGTRLHHLTKLADFGYPGRFRHFGHECMPSLADYGSGAGTGMLYLHEPGFPEDLGDALFSGDLNTGIAVHRRRRHEATFQVQQQSISQLPGTIDVDVDGFSRMYVASRSGGGFGFASKPFGHVDLVQPKDRTDAAVYPEIDKAGDAELLGHLASRSQVARVNAMREMVTRGRRPVFSKGLSAMAEDDKAPLYARAAAVMTLAQLDGAGSHAVLRRLYGDADVREFVVRALGDVGDAIDGAGRNLLLDALGDENPRVRLRAIAGLARTGDVSTAAAILPLAADEQLIADGPGPLDPDSEGWSAAHRAVPHTALRAVVKLNAVDLLLAKLDDTERREAALRGLQEIHDERVVEGLAAKVARTRDRELAKLITVALLRLHHREAAWDGRTWWGNRPNFKGPYYACSEWDGTDAVRAALRASFRKVDPKDYAELFRLMRRNRVPEGDLQLDIEFDEVLSYLDKPTLTPAEHAAVMVAAADEKRPEQELLRIYRYYEKRELPDGYHARVQILRKWGEGRAEGERQRRIYAEFVSGREFVGRVDALAPFLKDAHESSYKYAHLQLLNLLGDRSAPRETREAAAGELERTWADRKNIYPHRLRGLMLAFEEIDPTPYEKQLRPLVDHRDERVKQAAARYLQAIAESRSGKEGP